MVAVKDNMEITIDAVSKDGFIKDGFDIYEDGELIAYGAGKTVPFEKYIKLQEECEALKEECEALKEEIASSKKKKEKTEK